jgi:uncharacterized protein
MRRDERKISEFQLIEEIIMKADVCRIAIANNNIPYMVTMNFGYDPTGGGTIYFHCANEGRKLEMIKNNNHVCFEMDTDHTIYQGEKGCDWGMKYKSIVGYGDISFVTENEERIRGLNCIMSHYGGDKKYTYDDKVLGRTTILSLDITEMTGKKC